MPQKLDVKEAKPRIGKFCAFRERSPKEVLEKLNSWGLAEEDSIVLVSELRKEGFVDEQRFANAFCNDKFEFNSWGKLKIRASIFSHKLASEVVQRALDRIDPVRYENRLKDLAVNKWNSLKNEELMKRKQKTVTYMANKGFESDLIWNVIVGLEKESL